MINEGYLNNENDVNDGISHVVRLDDDTKKSKIFQKLFETLEPLDIWYWSLRDIEKKCGCVVLSYFRFITWLFKINLCMLIIQLSVLVIPFMVLKKESFDDLILDTRGNISDNMFVAAVNCSQKAISKETPTFVDLILDILQGLGPLEHLPMFIGYYFNVSSFNASSVEFTQGVFNTPMAYSFSFWLCIIASLIITLYSTGKSYKSFIIDDKFNDKFGLCVLTEFDFGVSTKKRIQNMKSDLSRKLKIQFQQIQQALTRSRLSNNQIFIIYLTRAVVNIIFIGFLLLIYYLIVFVQSVPIEAAKEPFINSNKILSFLIGYIPSITVAMINLVFQIINNKVVVLEKYSNVVAVGVCLKRLILVQAISLIIFVVTLLDQVKQSKITDTICQQTDVIKCWENFVGQQFFRFSIIGFVSLVIIGPLVQLVRSLVYTRFHTRNALVRLMGVSQFDLSIEGFLLISSQCVCWMGLWFSSFLIVIMLVELLLLFYIRKSMFMRNLYQITMETSSVAGGQRFLLEMLLYSLAFVMLPIGYILSNKIPSRGCSPYRIYPIPPNRYSFTSFMNDFLTSRSAPLTKFWNEFTSIYTILSILVLFIILAYIKYAQSKAYSEHISALRKQIIAEENNQMFYKRQLLNASEVAEKGNTL